MMANMTVSRVSASGAGAGHRNVVAQATHKQVIPLFIVRCQFN
jgi:hypothetical protein